MSQPKVTGDRGAEPRVVLHPQLLRDVVGLAGAGLLAYGAWLAYQPLGFMAGGTALLVLTVAGTLRGAR